MATGPASAGRPRFDIADIVRQHRTALEAEQRLTPSQGRVLSAIALCRTAALGGHIEVCRSCGLERACFHSCCNRNCPKCQALAQERWIAARAERLLPVRHFHVVFTLPSQLRALARYRPRDIYGALFAAASETLLELGRTRLEAQLGVTMVLHTWTRDLQLHPHLHALVTAGGAALDRSNWKPSGEKYLFAAKEIDRASGVETQCAETRPGATFHRSIASRHPEEDNPNRRSYLVTATASSEPPDGSRLHRPQVPVVWQPMRLHVFVALVTVLLLTACNPDGACIRVEPDRS